MSSTEPIASVVVSTHAAERLLAGCLDMLLAQSIGDGLEVIVIDSGSPEREADVIVPYLADERIRYVRTERETLYAAWNRALAMARGRYFANVNTDDWIAPHALATFAAALDTFDDCALAYADWAMTSSPTSAPTTADRVCRHEPWHPALHLFYCYSGCVQFWRRSALVSLGGFDGSLQCAGDLLALRRLVDAGMRAVYIPEVLVGFHLNPTGLSAGSDRSRLEQAEVLGAARTELAIDDLYAIDPDDPRAAADAWTALGVTAMDVQVPWHDGPLRDTGFALHCFDVALSLVPDHSDALHDRRVVITRTERNGEAEAGVTVHRHGPELRRVPVGPARTGEVFGPTGTGSPVGRVGIEPTTEGL